MRFNEVSEAHPIASSSSSALSNSLHSEASLRLPLQQLRAGISTTIPLILDARYAGAAASSLDLTAMLVCQSSSLEDDESAEVALGYACMSGSVAVAPLLRFATDFRPSNDGTAAYLQVSHSPWIWRVEHETHL